MQILLQQIVPTYFEKEQITGSEIWGKNITFSKGEHVHIVAPSGSGAGKQSADRGSIQVRVKLSVVLGGNKL